MLSITLRTDLSTVLIAGFNLGICPSERSKCILLIIGADVFA